jgi:phage terminase small subunit
MMRKTKKHIPSYNVFMTKTLVRPRTQYAPGIDLTPKQRAFVVALVRNGTTPTAAAREAGYNNPKVSSFDVLRLPHVAAAIRLERGRYISGELANIATGTLHAILIDKEAPASARVQAARTVLEMSGDIGKAKRTDDDDRPLSEMTAEELARLIDKWTEEKAAMATTIDAQDVEIIDSAQAMAHLPAATRTPA